MTVAKLTSRSYHYPRQETYCTCSNCQAVFTVTLPPFCSRACADAARSKVPIETRFWLKVAKTDGCWLWTGAKDQHGYGSLTRGTRTEGRAKAHRLAWQFANGPIPNGMDVCHHCDNPACVRPDHLFLGTARDNALDMFAKGRADRSYWRRHPEAIRRGSARGKSAKLTEDKVAEIRRRYAAGNVLQRELAMEYGVTAGCVSMLVNGHGWIHVPMEETIVDHRLRRT